MRYSALPTPIVRALQKGGPDAYGHPAERRQSDGLANPCRHCLQNIPQGRDMLILAHCPFPAPQPYAETGPVFLCADPCPQGGGTHMPAILHMSPDYLLKGYCDRDRIVYGTGAVIAQDQIERYGGKILSQPCVAYVHVRSARNNCYQLRIDRS